MGKGRGKGKNGRKGPAPVSSEFWNKKLEEENRTALDGMDIFGRCIFYNWKQGWGHLVPSDPDDLPPEALASLAESDKQGKNPEQEGNRIYFRRPDVEEGFKITKDAEVIFKIYM